MNDDNNKYLNEKYSDIIRKFEYKGEQMPFWFECGDGWFTLIDDLCGNIVHAIKNEKSILDYRKKQGEDVRKEDYEAVEVTISQVKEKYGGLRFYVYGGGDRIRGMIDFAESFSYKICESCGNPGKLSQNGWWRTLCEPCRANDERKKVEWEENYKRSLEQISDKNNI